MVLVQICTGSTAKWNRLTGHCCNQQTERTDNIWAVPHAIQNERIINIVILLSKLILLDMLAKVKQDEILLKFKWTINTTTSTLESKGKTFIVITTTVKLSRNNDNQWSSDKTYTEKVLNSNQVNHCAILRVDKSFYVRADYLLIKMRMCFCTEKHGIELIQRHLPYNSECCKLNKACQWSSWKSYARKKLMKLQTIFPFSIFKSAELLFKGFKIIQLA